MRLRIAGVPAARPMGKPLKLRVTLENTSGADIWLDGPLVENLLLTAGYTAPRPHPGTKSPALSVLCWGHEDFMVTRHPAKTLAGRRRSEVPEVIKRGARRSVTVDFGAHCRPMFAGSYEIHAHVIALGSGAHAGALPLYGRVSSPPVTVKLTGAPTDSFTLAEGVIGHPASRTVFVMGPAGTVDAFDAGTGKPRWTSAAATKPLVVLGDRLLAVAKGDPLSLVLLDRETGALAGACDTSALPPGFSIPVEDSRTRRAGLRGWSSRSGAVLRWYRHTVSGGGMARPTPPGGGLEEGLLEVVLPECAVRLVKREDLGALDTVDLTARYWFGAGKKHLLELAGATSRFEDGRTVDSRPRRVRAIHAATGRELWWLAVRSTDYLGPHPPGRPPLGRPVGSAPPPGRPGR